MKKILEIINSNALENLKNKEDLDKQDRRIEEIQSLQDTRSFHALGLKKEDLKLMLDACSTYSLFRRKEGYGGSAVKNSLLNKLKDLKASRIKLNDIDFI